MHVFLEKVEYFEHVSPKIQVIYTIVLVVMMRDHALMMRTTKDFVNLK